jgi:hypothetical protein
MTVLSTNQCLKNASIFRHYHITLYFKNATTTVSFQNPSLTQTRSYHLHSTSVATSTNGTDSNKCSVTVRMSWGKPTIRFVQYINILYQWCHVKEQSADQQNTGSVLQQNTTQNLFHGWCAVYIKQGHYQDNITNVGVKKNCHTKFTSNNLDVQYVCTKFYSLLGGGGGRDWLLY